MENNKFNETMEVSVKEEFDPFANTPWSSDDEIYDFVIQKKYIAEWDWEYIWNELVEKGLHPDYAYAIIEHTKEQGKEAKRKVRLQGIREFIGGILLCAAGVYCFFLSDIIPIRGSSLVIWAVAFISLITNGLYRLKRKF